MRKEPPKPRRERAKSGKTEAEVAAAEEEADAAAVEEALRAEREAANDLPVEGAGLHPIFGRGGLRAHSVLVRRIKYRSGNERSPPIPTGVGILEPSAIIDSSQLFPLYGPGRYQLCAVDINGLSAHPPLQFDVPDEVGEILPYLTAPMPSHVQGVAADPSQPSRPDPQAEAWKEIARQAEAGRSNDINAFLKLIEAERGRAGAGPDSFAVTFLQGELTRARGELATTMKERDEERAAHTRTREQLLRKTLGGDADLVDKGLNMLMERFSGGPMAPAPPAASAAPVASSSGETPEFIELPSPDTLRAALHARKVPMAVIVQAVKLFKAGGLDPELWSVVEPVAAMAGLV